MSTEPRAGAPATGIDPATALAGIDPDRSAADLGPGATGTDVDPAASGTQTDPAPAVADLDPGAARRQVLYWHMLSRLFVPEELPGLEAAALAVVEDTGLPASLLDPRTSVDTLVQRNPDLAAEITGLMVPGPEPDTDAADGEAEGPTRSPGETDLAETSGGADLAETSGGADQADTPGAEGVTQLHDRPAEIRRAALVSKVLVNVFATGTGTVSAGRLAAWQADAGWLERALGCEPGGLRGGRGAGGPDLAALGAVVGPRLGDLEADLVKRMHLREVLADPQLASRLTPSMSLVDQLLRDKDNLSGLALANAKSLIRRFVDQVAEVLRTQVAKTSVGELDRSVPPKRVFRNLDIDRTIWKNLTNYDPQTGRLYVDRLYYRRTARRTTPSRLIVVVDQSGSMVDAMVNCTILASIFTGLPKVDVHLVAYDTRAVDLTPWVHDPFETLLRTQLGGGTDGRAAMELVRPMVAEPRNTVVVWISDFYEWVHEELFASMSALHRSGVKFIPVGSVSSSGGASVNPWFRGKFKDQGTPVLSGHIRKLIVELKAFLT